VRFPGGVFADYYHWRDGIGPRDSRPSRQHSPSDKNVSPNNVGTHEIGEFARRIGGELMLQVNIITGSPEEAAEWVRYCNAPEHPERARNGSTQPFNVRYWEIGNESYIRGDSEATRKAFLNPREYADRFLKFAEAMKRVDPRIQVGAVGGRNFGKYGFVTDQNWNSTVLSRAGSAIDFYAVHNAYGPVAASTSKRSTEDVYRAMFAFPRQIERNLEELETEIRSRAGSANAGRIRIAVTEWGPYFHVIPDPFLDHVKTLGSGIYAAETLVTFLRHPKTELANFFKLTDVTWLGWIGRDGVPKPALLALQMFTRHFGAHLVEATVTGPGYNAPEAGMVAAEAAVPLVSSVASLNADRSKLYVLTVNKSLTETVETDLVLNSAAPRQNVVVQTLTAGAVDAHNGHRLPSLPGVNWGRPAKASRNSMYDSSRPGTVAIQQSSLKASGSTLRVRLQPLSVTSFEFQLR
jgi:alpha-N-arabinofuranosidase